MDNNIILTDDKLRIQFTNQKNFLSGGTVSILYADISSLSAVRNPAKIPYIILGVACIILGGYFTSFGTNMINLFLIGFGLLLLIWGFNMPNDFLGVETRGGSQYWVNVKGKNIYELIDNIEKKRK